MQKCENCGSEFEGKAEDQFCPCSEAIEQWWAEECAKEEAQKRWRQYFEQEEQEQEERNQRRHKEN